MKQWLIFIACLCLPMTLQAQEAWSATETVTAHLDSVVRNQLPAGSNVAISVFDLTEGTITYEYQPTMLSRPASNMKLLTAITALSLPQRNIPFRTELWMEGQIVQDTLHGNLYVVGGFDPEFDEEALAVFADSIASWGIKVVKGHLYGDVSMKDSLYWGNGWMWDDNPKAYQPYLSPLMLNKGTVKVTAIAGNAGEPARIETEPYSTYYQVENQTVSKQSRAGRFTLTRNWMENGNLLVVSGNVANRNTASVNLYRSENFFLHTLLDQLKAREIEVTQGYAFLPLPAEGCSLMAAFETPMQDVLNQMMKESDNLNAEAMLFRIGAQTTGKKHLSADEGTEAIKNLINTLGLKADNYHIVDGSGLSNYDYLSPQLLVAFLKYAYADEQIYPRLLQALPIAGVDGTLKTRMTKGSVAYRKVLAKTGSYTGVNCLSGYLQTRQGHQLAFAIMNQNVLSARDARSFQDKFCEELINTYVSESPTR